MSGRLTWDTPLARQHFPCVSTYQECGVSAITLLFELIPSLRLCIRWNRSSFTPCFTHIRFFVLLCAFSVYLAALRNSSTRVPARMSSSENFASAPEVLCRTSMPCFRYILQSCHRRDLLATRVDVRRLVLLTDFW